MKFIFLLENNNKASQALDSIYSISALLGSDGYLLSLQACIRPSLSNMADMEGAHSEFFR